MRKQDDLLNLLRELLLWGVANTICMGLPLAGVFLYGTHVARWHPALLAAAMTLTAILSATWGSWGTLVWTRNRLLRALQQGVTTLPGIAMGGLAGLLFYVSLGKWYLALICGAAGVGMIVTAVYLAGGFFSKNETPGPRQYVTGLLMYPVVTTLASALTFALWKSVGMSLPLELAAKLPIPNLPIPKLISLSTLLTGTMAAALITTIIPAAASKLATDAANGSLLRRLGS